MARYQIYFFDRAGSVFDALQLEQETDEAAIAEARYIDVSSLGAGYDVWHEQRLVHRHRRS